MKSQDVRQSFIEYFKNLKHEPVPSSRLVPDNDPTLLFNNAGMNQFKNVFMGLEKRTNNRAVSSQKCVRAGGKHNDLENVGHTARHHTFFEMLGNFSFGDYFKKDAIHFAWQLITKEWQIDKNRLYVTVFETDDEAADIWHKQEGVPTDRIYRFGEKDNFWRMGDSGPCGPCSEIFYDLGPEVPGSAKDNVMGGEGDRYMEFWNLVFMQYHEDGRGGRAPLPKPSVDTGMGLERISSILQGKINNYENDLFFDLILAASNLSGVEYHARNAKFEEQNVALRVLADHARASAFLIADGVIPSNEGRGYVLRRIMRRAIRYARKLDLNQSVFLAVVQAAIKKMGAPYPELNERSDLILRTVKDEESRFLSTLDQGTHVLQGELAKIGSGGTLPGAVAFKLYDTYGFPLDLTVLMTAEHGMKVDEAGFTKHLSDAKEVARASWKGKGLSSDQASMVQWASAVGAKSGATNFTGYESLDSNSSQIQALLADGKDAKSLSEGQEGVLIANQTPFYAEGGGQMGDHGELITSSGQAEVLDCTKLNDQHLHFIKVTDGKIEVGQSAQLKVSSALRKSTARNHSATHLLHSSLRSVLGDHIQQAGSLVTSDRLRFDFTHPKPLSESEKSQVEELVNREISAGTRVISETMGQKEALKMGALALFGEKYGDEVRVIQMGPFSTELCGGTHVQNTSDIRLFKIVSEAGVSSGVRRIEAITGDTAIKWLSKLSEEALEARQTAGLSTPWQQYLSEADTLTTGSASSVIVALKSESKELQKQIQKMKGESVDSKSLASEAQKISGKSGQLLFLFKTLEIDDRKVLSDLSDQLRDRLSDSVIVLLGAKADSGYPVLVNVSKSLTPKTNAGALLKKIAEMMGGKGGGRPDFAQGNVPDIAKISQVKEWLIKELEG